MFQGSYALYQTKKKDSPLKKIWQIIGLIK